MRQSAHPDYVAATITYTRGNTPEICSIVAFDEIRVGAYSARHPSYTGKQETPDTGGRVARFET